METLVGGLFLEEGKADVTKVLDGSQTVSVHWNRCSQGMGRERVVWVITRMPLINMPGILSPSPQITELSLHRTIARDLPEQTTLIYSKVVITQNGMIILQHARSSPSRLQVAQGSQCSTDVDNLPFV